ncbi:SMI1/KNR4 family protein [Paenibacillus gallinarum]|uniref:SMI1/KNR4 family protein n=1 Tax=Paenibacillus gallinarum TaxID=2762232 RepID=A0ABR8STB6_9BACL|nr:SMI1/KNR4 family protein [Paenibacillus gallinarum]MBD7966645.1 SMI1/KNR4 family protein [Paenibacillus gallinarum]
MSETIIDKTIISLKKRLSENNNLLILQLNEGYVTEPTCNFNEPFTDKGIKQYIQELGYDLPSDYIAFLKICNGCNLFDHPVYGGESYLYRLEDIKLLTYEEPTEGYLKIGYFYQDNLVIDLKKYSEGQKNYLLVKGHIDNFYEARELNMNFELWFDRFIMSQGSKFWTWSNYTAENYYYLR